MNDIPSSLFAFSLENARSLDQSDELKAFRQEFEFPKNEEGEPSLYFAGHSLGLMPKKVPESLLEQCRVWGHYAVEGHFKEDSQWFSFHEKVTSSLAQIVGAHDDEVVAMNSLTTNLHLMLTSFYRPTKKKYKILVEEHLFPSDRYALTSQIRLHGFDPKETLVELSSETGNFHLDKENILATIKSIGNELALVFLGHSQYLSGQVFPIVDITQGAHRVGAKVGLSLAHGVGNISLSLHDWQVDFAVWCSYKYLNAGPGSIGGAYVWNEHFKIIEKIPRLEGWWGHDKQSRFLMGKEFKPVMSVEAWQLSNPPIFQLVSLRTSLDLFDKATIKKIRKKSKLLTSYLDFLIQHQLSDYFEIITPKDELGQEMRGSMLCLRAKVGPIKTKSFLEKIKNSGVIIDFREPNIFRMTPAPLYNNFEDVYRLISSLKVAVHL